MRKPDEIKKGLECCVRRCDYDNGCAYAGSMKCCDNLKIDALAYIQQLERERDALLADLKEADMNDCCHCKSYIHSENNACEAADFNCDACENNDCMCKDCRNNNHWEWRGVQEDENNGE